MTKSSKSSTKQPLQRDDFLSERQLFGSEDSPKMKSLLQWLKTKNVKNFDRVALTTESAPAEAVKQIEEELDGLLLQESLSPAASDHLLRRAWRQEFLKPADVPHRLLKQEFTLGDRVIYVLETGNVPLFARGVVIGMDVAHVEVVFDKTFLSGTNLNGR